MLGAILPGIEESVAAYCPLCGSEMTETYRMSHEGQIWVFLKCNRFECEGKVTRKGISGLSRQGSLSLSTSTQDS
jgi:formate dehydrogenase maturation protein FdhE